MGTYLNPGNKGFREILQSEYVDKTGLIALVNITVNTMRKLTCISRPRRFGKSYAAKMLCAYYDLSCDSHGLFDDKEIAKTEGYLKHMNQYHVISLDITGFISEAKRQRKSMADVPGNIVNAVHKVVAAAYMTGILPIKKDGSQPAISDFKEVTILAPGRFVEFTGFTENEVRSLCGKYGMDFNEIRQWYDGYDFPGCGSIYNPYSVMYAMQEQKCRSYWQKTSAAESLMTYINMDFEGLQETIARLISNEEIEVRTDRFANDFETFKSRDDVLTLLIHLGYLTWNEEDGTAHVPNEEVQAEFEQILAGTGANRKWMDLLNRSEKLLKDTIAGNAKAVAKAIQAVRETQYAPTFYNDEQALRYVIKFAYIAALDQYLKVEELPSGRGIADVIYLPKRRSALPALVVELKWNKTSESAIRQIKERNYPAVLEDYYGEIVLVGINYDAVKKEHSCMIEKASAELFS